MKKLVCIVLALIMLGGMLAGCGGATPVESTTAAETTAAEVTEAATTAASTAEATPVATTESNLGELGHLPVVYKPVKLSILTHEGYGFALKPSNDLRIYQKLQEMTNVEIEWQSAPTANLTEVINVRLAAGSDLPDMINCLGITGDDIRKYGNNGLFLELSDLINNDSYYMKGVFNTNPVAKVPYLDENGKIFSLPDSIVMETEWQYGTLINQRWLDKLGLQVPITTDEFYSVLKAFKDGDPNGNKKADEIPLGADWALDVLGAAWGLNTEFNSVPGITVDSSGKVQMDYISPKMKEYWTYLNKLYSEGLIDKDFTSNTLDTIAEKIGQDRIGAISWYIGLGITWNKLYDQTGNTVVFHPIAPLIGPYGDQEHYKRNPILGNWVITKECKNPEIAMRWYDAVAFNPDIVNLLLWGIEGETYEVKNGVKQMINNDRDKLVKMGGFEWALPNHQLAENGFDISNSMLTEYDKKYNRVHFTLTPFPQVATTKVEGDELKKFGTEIDTYYAEMRVKFITGQEPLSIFDAYVNRLKELGIEKIQAIRQAQYDRYKALSGK